MRMIAFILFSTLSPLSWSQLAIGPELSILNQKDPKPIAVGGVAKAAFKVGMRWHLTISGVSTLKQRENVDRIWGDPRALASGGVPQHNVGRIYHQRQQILLSVERLLTDRNDQWALGLGAGYYRYLQDVDMRITILATGSSHRSEYLSADGSFILLP